MRAETAAAVRAARLAQKIADSRDGADAVRVKQGIDIVTAADLSCEDAIRAELTRSFPDYPVIGEERGGEVRAGVPYWLVDPICGTRCYASNVPLYCTNIALVEDDRWYLWTFGSTVGYAYLAMGRIAGIVHIAHATQWSEPPVHTAAGCLVAAEAGATVTDLDSGAPWTLATRSFVIAATSRLHRELSELVKAVT